MVDQSRGSDSDLVLLLLLSSLLNEDYDPFVSEKLYDRLRYRLSNSELDDPDIRYLLEDRLFRKRRRGFSKDRQYEVREIAEDVFKRFQSSTPESTLMKFSMFESKLKAVESSLNETNDLAKETKTELFDLKTSAQDYLWLLSSGVDISEVELKRYLPVRIYVSDPLPSQNTLNKLASSVEDLLREENFEKTDEFPDESGSWWKRFVLRTKGVATSKEVAERLKKAERATEIAILDKPQAEANQCQAQAAASIISSLSETTNACVQAGSLLVVKATTNGNSAVVVRTLTPLELKRLEENQSLLRKPEQILEWLQHSCEKQLTSQASGTPQSGAPS